MSNGGGQYHSFGPFNDDANNVNFEDIYVYAYDAGAYSVAKNFWTAEAKTGAVTSRQGDGTGKVDGYFDGDYNFEIRESDNVTVIKQIPSMKITSDTGTMWEGGQGTGDPASTVKGMQHVKFDGSSNLLKFRISDGTNWVTIQEFTAAGLEVTDSSITATMPVYNVKHSDYGAVGDGVTDDTAAIQLAIDAIETAGAGVLYFPNATYVVDGTLVITNTSIMITGDGKGQSILLQQNTPSGAMIDYDTNNIEDVFLMERMSIQSEIGSVTAGDHCLDLAWPSTATDNYPSNFSMSSVSIGPTDATKTSSGFEYDLILTHAKKPYITNCDIRGHSGGTLEGEGIRLLGYTNRVSISNTSIHYKDIGIIIDDNTNEVKIDNLDCLGVRQGITLDVTATNFSIKDSVIVASEDGVKVLTNWAGLYEISDCRISKTSTSILAFVGITSKATLYIISGNTVYDEGSSSGTDYGIEVTDGTDGTIEGNIIVDLRTAGIRLAGGVSDFIVSNNRINTAITGIEVLAGASNDYVIVGNNLEGCTTGITDGGTGTTKVISNNLNGGTSETETLQVEIAELTMSAPGTQATLWSKTLVADTAYVIQADIVGVFTAGTPGVANIGALLSITVDDGGERDSALTYSYTTGGTYAVTSDVSGGASRIRVTGGASDMKWKASVRVLTLAV